MDAGSVCRVAALLNKYGIAAKPFFRADEPLAPDTLHALAETGAAVETACPAAARQCMEAGLTDRQLFLRLDGQAPETLAALAGRVRFLAASPAAVRLLDRALDGLLSPGRLAPTGVYLQPDTQTPDAFSAGDIPALSVCLRRTRNLTLRSVVLLLNGAADPAAAATEAFSLIKRLRADIPCQLHSFCLDGLLPRLSGSDALIRTLRMLSALNDSSLYADFYIG